MEIYFKLEGKSMKTWDCEPSFLIAVTFNVFKF